MKKCRLARLTGEVENGEIAFTTQGKQVSNSFTVTGWEGKAFIRY